MQWWKQAIARNIFIKEIGSTDFIFAILGAILFFCFTLKYWDKKEACDKLLEKLNEMEQKNG